MLDHAARPRARPRRRRRRGSHRRGPDRGELLLSRSRAAAQLRLCRAGGGAGRWLRLSRRFARQRRPRRSPSRRFRLADGPARRGNPQIAGARRQRRRPRGDLRARNLFRLVRAAGRNALSDDASFALSRADSRLSANAPQLRWSNRLAVLFALAAMAGLLALSPGLLDLDLDLPLVAVPVRNLRAALRFRREPTARRRRRRSCAKASCRPIRSSRRCIARRASPRNSCARSAALDYPPAKLDVKIVAGA